ncbi:hypothetical protein NDR87_24855 [Nocardia sp. CDC159]|uniref:Uncharacterized protein n=1 Tax=Nocardia pulmonis TaxID=2951408 RepID=A0A9X2IX97_9NOCA|nr:MULTISPECIES: hypothetical protein [Nocardia]MCM6775133.1 hypothetical protein [Nocardia pulmonis]MCM6789603.1 hypothetical protein [Nocardia sp. CDC159]
MSRLSVVDEIFLRTHRGMGTPIALQGLWRTAGRVEPELLRQLHSALRVGPLGRRVVRPRVPGARRYWRANDRAHPLLIEPRPIRMDQLWEWAQAQGFDLDPEFGPGWRLSATRLVDRSSVVALTCSHALADGRGLVTAVDRALSGRVDTERPVVRSDWDDARRQLSTVLGGTVRALRRGVPTPPATTAPRTASDAATRSAVLQIPAADWELTAAARGGTANSLFVHVVAKMLWDSGFPESEITASLPVDTRDESRVDNDMAMTEITVTRTDTPATIREKCRAAYEYRMTSPGGLPEEILQVLPDRLAHRLSRGAGERDILCSNIGALPDSLTHLGPHRCTGVAARAIHPGLTPARLPRTRLSGYLSRIAHTYTLALIGLDPEHIRSHAELTDLARGTLADLDLTATHW